MSYEAWRERVLGEVGKEGFAALSTTLAEGLEIEPLFTVDHPRKEPEASPGWREPHGSWRICAEHASDDAEALCRAIADDLAGGVSSIRLDVGDGGLPMGSTQELAAILGELPAGSVELGLDAGSDALTAARWLLATMESEGLVPADWRLVFHADPLRGLAAGPDGPAGSLNDLEREQAVLARLSVEALPLTRSVGVDLAAYRDSGATTVQELGYAVATGIHYLRSLETAGLSVAESAGEISFITGVGEDLFLEISKLRAMRLLWTRALAACGVADGPAPRIHAVSSRRLFSQEVPWDNILRVTSSTVAAALGGADVVTSMPFDAGRAVDGGPDSRRLARSTQLILAEESHLSRVIDPAGGSYYVEWLTERLAREAWDLLRDVERRGGMLECLTSGWVGAEVARAAGEASS